MKNSSAKITRQRRTPGDVGIIPTEIWILIVSYLDALSLEALRQTSRRFRMILERPQYRRGACIKFTALNLAVQNHSISQVTWVWKNWASCGHLRTLLSQQGAGLLRYLMDKECRAILLDVILTCSLCDSQECRRVLTSHAAGSSSRLRWLSRVGMLHEETAWRTTQKPSTLRWLLARAQQQGIGSQLAVRRHIRRLLKHGMRSNETPPWLLSDVRAAALYTKMHTNLLRYRQRKARKQSRTALKKSGGNRRGY